jgi:hypothetical protein
MTLPPLRAVTAFTALLALPTLAAADVSDALVPIGVVGSVFGFTAIMVGIVAYATFRARRLQHETIRLAIEKGQPLPPGLLAAGDQGGRGGAHRDLRRGVVLLGIGVGVSLFLLCSDVPGMRHNWTVGFIPGFLGIAFVVSFALSRRLYGKGEADRG